MTRQDLSHGVQTAQSCHAVAEFAYFNHEKFKLWRQKSNYKICLEATNEKSLSKLLLKLQDKNVAVSAFYEPDINNELTAITFVSDPTLDKYTKYFPLVGKKRTSC